MNEIYVFEKLDGGRLKVDMNVVNKMTTFRQDTFNKPESGGVLLGRFLKNSADIVIDDITVPMTGDKHSRFHFFRSQSSHQNIITKMWKESQGTCNYLGEWHTHPEDFPNPSRTDIEGWIHKLKKDRFDSECIYFIIVGIKEIAVWEGNRATLKISKLKRQE